MNPRTEQLEAAGATPKTAQRIAAVIEAAGSPSDAWQVLTNGILTPSVPFGVHHQAFTMIYADWDDSNGPPFAWFPDRSDIEESNLHRFCATVGVTLEQLHRWSASHRADFWRRVIDTVGIVFKQEADVMLDDSDVERPGWLLGARMNAVDSCFRCVGTDTAILHQAEGGTLEALSYESLHLLVNRVANSVRNIGLGRGSAVAIAMPMTVEAVAAYLGIVKAGCVVVSIADSFAPEEIATRLRISDARAVITQDVIVRAGKTLPMYEKVVAAGAKLAVVISATRERAKLRDGDLSWADFLVENDVFASVSCQPDDAMNILFSSGTTGDPKAIPWTHTTPIKCAADGYLHHDIQPGDVVAWPTNLGWMMGPWLIYATLMNRGTIALYYGAPTQREFCEFVRNAGVNMLGLVPSLVKVWRSTDDVADIDWSCIKLFSSTGESSNANDYLYLMSLAGYRPVIEYCGGTEIGGGYLSGTIVQPASPATFSTPAFGLDFVILDDEAKPADEGELFLSPPSIGLSTHLLNKNHHDVYFRDTPRGPNGEKLRRHGDRIHRIGGGYYRAEGRADDTMNLGGIKVSSAEIERAISAVPGIVETAAIAVAPTGGGPSQLVVYAVAEDSTLGGPDTVKAMQQAVSGGLNPLFRIHDVVMIDALPRTASNKVMRRVLRDQYRENAG